MPTLTIAPGLFAWTLALEDGTELQVPASSAQSALAGTVPSPVIGLTRGAVLDGSVVSTPPVLGSLVPTSAQIGAANFTLRVLGTGFRPDSVILWNGGQEPTTYVSPTEVTTAVNMATATTPALIPIQVLNLPGVLSNTLTFDLQPAAGAGTTGTPPPAC
jgi:hypothetical protein